MFITLMRLHMGFLRHPWLRTTGFFRAFDKRLLPVQAGILATFALTPVWYRFKGAPGDFETLYSTGFLIFWPMLWTVGWWMAAGLPGFAALRRTKVRRLWALALLMLALWAFLSGAWAFTRRFAPEVTTGAALPLALAALFAIAVACAGPPPRVIASALIVGAAWNAALAGMQVAGQESVGLNALGEFRLNPAVSGVAVVQAEGVRWLRPYGLLPHPNILAGFLAVALLMTPAWFLSGSRRRWAAGTTIFLCGLWGLLLTFSRGAWLGFAAGAFAGLPLVWRARAAWRRLVLVLTLGLAAAGAFAVLYGPFLAARAGVGEESIEQRSVSDRAVYMDFAYRAIRESPLAGVGMGNFPWRASYYLQFTPYDLRGQPAHHIFLSAWAELGAVGYALTAVALVMGIEAGLTAVRKNSQDERDTLARAAFLGGIVALMIIGLLDHYPWTLLHFQALWWGLLGAAGSQGLTGTGGASTSGSVPQAPAA